MATNTMNKGTAIVGFVLAFVTGAGFMYAVDRGEKNKDDITASGEKGAAGGGGSGEVWKQDALVPVSSDDPSHGPKTAQVTIVEFSDYQ